MILAIVQARIGSSRLPGKVLKEIRGQALIEILLRRLSKSKKIDKIILATSENSENDFLELLVKKLGFDVFRGSEKDVLERYWKAASKYKVETVVRITGDCPIIDPQIVDKVINLYQVNVNIVDYASNVEPPTFPDGLDTEVFSISALEKVYQQAMNPYDREHVTSFIHSNGQFKRINFSNENDFSNERWTVDTSEDFEVIQHIIEHFSPDLNFTWKDVLSLKKSHPEYFEANKNIKRNDGSRIE